MRREPSPGLDVTLTLDMELMRTIDRAFRGHPSGAAVVVDVRTGRVRALYSKPTYDLNEMSGHLSQDRYAELEEDPFRPLIDKTIYESYFPGSTFKVVTALAALEDGVFDPGTRVDVPRLLPDRKPSAYAARPRTAKSTCARRSSSRATSTSDARREVGLDRLNALRRTTSGFGVPTGIGINSEASGFIADARVVRAAVPAGVPARLHAQRGDRPGQHEGHADAARDGVRRDRERRHALRTADRRARRRPDGTVIRRVRAASAAARAVYPRAPAYIADGSTASSTIRTVRRTTRASRTASRSRARRAPRRSSRRAARDGDDPRRTWYFNRDHAWFAGFAPARNPEIAIVVLVEHGGGGGKYAAPIAINVVQDYLGGRVVTATAASAGRGAAVARAATAGGRPPPRGGRRRRGWRGRRWRRSRGSARPLRLAALRRRRGRSP